MQSRWGVLGLVVVARTAMAFQFQSATAVGPLLVADLGLSYAQLGTLIGSTSYPAPSSRCPAASWARGTATARLSCRRWA